MWQILGGLYLGDRDDARALAGLRRRGITHVLNVAKEQPCHFCGEFAYLHLDLDDPDERFGALIPQVCEFIDAGRREGHVLVHCSAGVSRSAAAVLAYLCHGGQPLDAAARQLAGSVLTNPDPVFLRQLGARFGLRLGRADVERLSLALLGRA